MVVDGSKSYRKAKLMARELGRSWVIKVLHVVRDPRGFVASWLRSDPTATLRTSSWLWAETHRRMEALASTNVPYLRVRYEDLALRPEHEMKSIFDFLNLPWESVIAAPRFPEKHHLIGNKMLFSFDGTVLLHEGWRDQFSPEDQIRVLRYAGRAAENYGYV
jgi:hypothetical protein